MAGRFGEDNLQKAVAYYLDLQPILWCHVANERRTSIKAGSRLKEKGVKSGVPDVMIFTKRGHWSGMAIELKMKGNSLTENQKKWLKKLESEHWYCVVCYNLDEVINAFKLYNESKTIIKPGSS